MLLRRFLWFGFFFFGFCWFFCFCLLVLVFNRAEARGQMVKVIDWLSAFIPGQQLVSAHHGNPIFLARNLLRSSMWHNSAWEEVCWGFQGVVFLLLKMRLWRERPLFFLWMLPCLMWVLEWLQLSCYESEDENNTKDGKADQWKELVPHDIVESLDHSVLPYLWFSSSVRLRHLPIV